MTHRVGPMHGCTGLRGATLSWGYDRFPGFNILIGNITNIYRAFAGCLCTTR